jgi:hypothetical protein
MRNIPSSHKKYQILFDKMFSMIKFTVIEILGQGCTDGFTNDFARLPPHKNNKKPKKKGKLQVGKF